MLPPLRNRSLNLRYRSWFWLCLLSSAIASVVSLAVYPSQPIISLMFGYGAGFAQVVSTLLLVECVEKAVNAGVIGGLEMT
jgi:sorbitol-specific phosphotransferase system component IIBC